ncbi:MAG: hypothetical protein D6691_04260 [Candidatus Hydrogenedentota bacterium]|nr:MAG: hypothetical protein D6691_04260 [Candidatus Hydrogenedentota bacterium]GIX43690.1 MAG: hypothetical protein KatS3mg130_0098 [Candidatus Sumerlaea sp.]
MRTSLAVLIAMTVFLVGWLPRPVRAEEFLLPDAQELATLPPEALTFYAQGIKALDHINYEAAYESLSKAAVLQPNAVRLNLIVAALALKFGRSKKADEAKEYYETAIASYQNILQVRGLDPILRRNVQNRLKIAIEERDNLSQRDAQREGKGGLFIQKYNRELVEAKATPKPTPAAPAVPGAPGMPALPGAVPVQAPYGQPQPGVAQIPALPQAPAYPGAETPAPALQPGAATAVGIDVPPAEPGMPAPQPMPGQPGGMPGLPPLPGAGGQPAAPAGQPPLI